MESKRGSQAPPPLSVLTILQEKTGEAPRISLREEDTGLGGASPVIDPLSAEKLALPQGKGNYQLMGEIARGGMGVVLEGHDTDLGRDVALKVLHKDLAGRPEVLQSFVEEARLEPMPISTVESGALNELLGFRREAAARLGDE